jgi:Immunity protein 40
MARGMIDPLRDLNLPPTLLSQAQVVSAGGRPQAAWSRPAALELLQELRGRGIAVLSGDVIRLEGELPRPTRDNWHAEPAHGEPFDAFAHRSLSEAAAYISGYREPGPNHWFILMLADRLP